MVLHTIDYQSFICPLLLANVVADLWILLINLWEFDLLSKQAPLNAFVVEEKKQPWFSQLKLLYQELVSSSGLICSYTTTSPKALKLIQPEEATLISETWMF